MNSYRPKQKPHDQYKKQSIETASPVKLVVMLYEGAIRFIDKAIETMDYKTYDQVNENIQRAKDIVVELRLSLNFKSGGEVATRLDSLYDYVFSKLGEGNVKKNVKPLKEARKVISDLLGSWNEIAQAPEAGESNKRSSSSFSLEG